MALCNRVVPRLPIHCAESRDVSYTKPELECEKAACGSISNEATSM
eukprot:CAMPEP_0180513614 /NCGR_PEP_ID=MMETSP1036_2-20121128/52275_1 /TAXON_ID=632150 /ORGANISM="Azadinium spinosum, Strain 3D9" /LENGTH=45 /DNA_ID= /DNA_START= /DNA_END= /DNA_ORIENTATION=